MTTRVATLEMPRQEELVQARTRLDHEMVQLRKVGRRAMLLYVGVWASLYDVASGFVAAGHRLIDSAEQRGERMEEYAVRRFKQLEQKTVGQLQEIQETIHLDDARTSLDNTFIQTQDELADRIQAVLDDMGIPSREQLARLNREIDLLNDKIDGELQARMVRA